MKNNIFIAMVIVFGFIPFIYCSQKMYTAEEVASLMNDQSKRQQNEYYQERPQGLQKYSNEQQAQNNKKTGLQKFMQGARIAVKGTGKAIVNLPNTVDQLTEGINKTTLGIVQVKKKISDASQSLQTVAENSKQQLIGSLGDSYKKINEAATNTQDSLNKSIEETKKAGNQLMTTANSSKNIILGNENTSEKHEHISSPHQEEHSSSVGHGSGHHDD